jgi:hypothetical protein
MMLYTVSRRPAIDNPRLVQITIGCGIAISVIGLTFCLVCGLPLGFETQSWFKGNPSR